MWKKTLAAALVTIAGTASAATVSTLNNAGGQAIYWGLTNTSTYGQTLTLEHAAKLDTFEFRADDNGTLVSYDFQIFAWDGNGPTGPALYTVSAQTVGTPGFTDYVIDLGDLSLDGGQYVLLLGATSEGAVAFATSEGAYSEGSWVYQEDAWYVDDTIDLSFEITYEGTS